MTATHKFLLIIVGLAIFAVCIYKPREPKKIEVLKETGPETAPNKIGPAYLVSNLPWMIRPPVAPIIPQIARLK